MSITEILRMNYNKQSYRLILQKAKECSFEFVDFFTVDINSTKRRQIILRHDIDYSLSMALEIAEIDASYQIKSTFGLLLSSPLYNPFTSANIKIINEIQRLGHNIVLHHNTLPGQSINEIKHEILREMEALRAFFPNVKPVFIWHNLQSNNFLNDIEIPTMINAYNTKYVKEMYYISDSVLRNGTEDFLSALGRYDILHMLLHPVIWMSEKSDMISMVSYVLTTVIRECDKEFMINRAWKKKFPEGMPQTSLNMLEEFLSKD
jgi:hypothetical protein